MTKTEAMMEKLRVELEGAKMRVVDDGLASADAALEVKVLHNEIRRLNGQKPEYNFVVPKYVAPVVALSK